MKGRDDLIRNINYIISRGGTAYFGKWRFFFEWDVGYTATNGNVSHTDEDSLAALVDAMIFRGELNDNSN